MNAWLGLLLKYCDVKGGVVVSLEKWLSSYMKKQNVSSSAVGVILPCFCTICTRTVNLFDSLLSISDSIHNVLKHSKTQDLSPTLITEGRKS